MKNSAYRLLQLLKTISPLALAVLAVSLSQSALAQPTFSDVFPILSPPIPGPNDVSQTNTAGRTVSNGGAINGYTDAINGGYYVGTTFFTGSNPAGYAVTNFFWECAGNGSSGNNYGGDIAWVQPYVINFYQIGGGNLVAGTGLSADATLIATITTSPGELAITNDWMSYSNFAVFLAPNTTNAITFGRVAGGNTAYDGIPLHQVAAPIPGIAECRIAPAGGASSVQYDPATVIANGAGRSNWDLIFSIGMQAVPAAASAPVMITNPVGYHMVSFPSTFAAVLSASAAGSSNSPFGIGGFWQKGTTNVANGPTNWVSVTSGANSTIAGPTITNDGYNGAIISSTLSVLNIPTTSGYGAYQFVVSNSADGVHINWTTSAVATISVVPAPAASSFTGVLLNTPGLLSYWPLNETQDPGLGYVPVYDIVGGFNGYYMHNAGDGGGNAGLGLAPVAGPEAPGLAGFPATQGAWLGNSNLVDSWIAVPVTPTMPGGTGTLNSTNATLIAWVYPSVLNEAAQTGLFGISRQNPEPTTALNNTENTMMAYGNGSGNHLGWNWNNGAANTYGYNAGPVIPPYLWSMLAVVVTPSNAVFYVCNTNSGHDRDQSEYDEWDHLQQHL